MNGIVIGTDGSQSSRAAVESGVELAGPTRAPLTVAYVMRAPSPVLGRPYYQRALSRELAKGRAALDEAATLVHAAGLECETELVEGKAAEALLSTARARDAGLIVVGSRGLGVVNGTLLGSVSRRVVHDADRPVLVVTQRHRRARLAA